MKHFKSNLGPLLEDYICYRRSLGFDLKSLQSPLCRFDRYLLAHKADLNHLTPTFFLELKITLKDKRPTFNGLLRAVRGFCAYLVRRQIMAHNPLTDIEAYRRNAFIPFIFSARQTDRLIAAAGQCIRDQPTYFVKDYGVYLAIVLLARCGLRISEPLRLKCHDYQHLEKTIYIAKTKFSKDRLIPVPSKTCVEIDNYLSLRRALVTDENPYLLFGHNGRAISENRVYQMFNRAVKTIGIDQPRHIVANTTFGSPTPHSLRHSFAVNTLKAVKQRGHSPQHALPVLSSYLGHSKYRYTAVYLKVLDADHRQGLVDFAIRRQEEI
jgi:site-specific recombinase XerD